MSNIKSEGADLFFNAILTLETLEECYDFFQDICTEQEIKAISQRFLVAKMLDEKKVYSEIVSSTGASTATVSRVKRSMLGGKGSYKRAFTRMGK